MTDAWEMHQAETGLNPGPVWRDRGVIINTLTERNQALEERVAELEGSCQKLRDDYQGALAELAESRAEGERIEESRKRWRRACAKACHRAETAEAEMWALRERLTALADEAPYPDVPVELIRAALAASPAEDTTPTEQQAQEGAERANDESTLDLEGEWEIRATIYRNGRRVATCDTTSRSTYDHAPYWLGEGLVTREVEFHVPKRRRPAPVADPSGDTP